MRKILLMSSALVVSGLLSGGAANAACIQTPTCSSLGYTSSSSCTGGTKCPFGNAWNCTVVDLTNKITEITNKITTIEEKITEIEENGGGSGGTNPAIGDCVVGAVLNSDKTCSSEIISGKTPIGVVFHAERRLAIALNTQQEMWGFADNIPGYPTWSSATANIQDWAGKENTLMYLNYCKNEGMAFCSGAFEYVGDYKREGTSAGDWYLPALAELQSIYDNKEVLNTTLTKIGGSPLPEEDHWSSTLRTEGSAWYIGLKGGWVSTKSTRYYEKTYVRPVLAF